MDHGDAEAIDDDEFFRLTDYPSPLFRLALDYLVKQDLGLAPSREELEPVLIEAILIVHQEMNRQKETKRERDKELDDVHRDLKAGLK